MFDSSMRDALRDLHIVDEIVVLTWLHRADRSRLLVHPRDDVSRPPQGVFSTRSAERPNPIGLHRTTILSVRDGLKFRSVKRGLEFLHDVRRRLPWDRIDTWTSAQLLVWLDEIEPGFSAWAASFER